MIREVVQRLLMAVLQKRIDESASRWTRSTTVKEEVQPPAYTDLGRKSVEPCHTQPFFLTLSTLCRKLHRMPREFLTYSSALVLQAIASGYRYGFDVMDVTGLPSGTVYPALRKLE